METLTTDICVIGAGAGGLSVAAGAVQMGARVVLIEGGEMGGDCLNHGCVPSKALLSSARVAASRSRGAALGVEPVVPRVDFAQAQAHVASVITAIAPHDSQERFEGLGCTVIRDWARFTSPRDVVAGGKRIRARRFVVATGSRPALPPIPGLDQVPVQTNETIFSLTEQPAHLLIIGAGPIGMEMAQAHRRLGSEVTVLEADRALGAEDPDAARFVTETIGSEGVRLIQGAQVTQVSGQAGSIELSCADGTRHQGTHLMVATGRKPAIEGLNLEAAGVRFTRSGIEVNASLRSSNRRIYAIGDVAGQGQFTHLAGYHAGLIVRSMLFALPSKTGRTPIPRVTYTSPELAQIGPTEAEARRQHGDKVEVFKLGFEANDRALAEGASEGLIKLMVLKGRPVGVTIAGENAGEMIAFWSLAIANRLKLSAIAGTIFPYPTRAELSKRVAGAYFTPKLFESDLVKRVVRLVQRMLP